MKPKGTKERYAMKWLKLAGPVFLLFLSSCASPPSQKDQRPLTFFFTQGRELELAPCGCSTNPKGGVERQLNYFKKNKKELDWYFAMGPAFAPDSQLYYPKLLSKYKEKAQKLSEAYRKLNLNYLGLSAHEFIWNEDELEQFKSQGGFVFLSANLFWKKNKKPVADQFVWLGPEKKVLLTSLSDAPSTKFKHVLQSIEVADPKKSLDALINQMSPAPELVVILTNLPKTKISELELVSGTPTLYLGPTFNLELQWEQNQKQNFYAWVAPRAQAVLKGNLSLEDKPAGFYFRRKQAEIELYLKQNQNDQKALEKAKALQTIPNESLVRIEDLQSTILTKKWEDSK